MLRLLVLFLVLANVGYFAWSRGMLADYGVGSAGQSEPQRLMQQIKPDTLQIVLPPPRPRPDASSNTRPDTRSVVPAGAALLPTAQVRLNTECLQVGTFNEEQTVVLQERLASTMPAGSWALRSVVEPARWIVYMGKFANAEAAARKRNELRGLNVVSEPVNNALLEPGLSLGGFATQAEAAAELNRIARKGVKTARIMQDRTEQRGQRLTLPAVDTALRSQLDAIKPQLAGKLFEACL